MDTEIKKSVIVDSSTCKVATRSTNSDSISDMLRRDAHSTARLRPMDCPKRCSRNSSYRAARVERYRVDFHTTGEIGAGSTKHN